MLKISDLQPALQSAVMGVACYAVENKLNADDVRELWRLGVKAAILSTNDGAAAHAVATRDNPPRPLGRKLLAQG